MFKVFTTVVFVISSLFFSIPEATAFDPFGKKNDFLDVDQAFKFSTQQSGDQVIVYWEIADDYYLYKHKMDFEAKGATLEPVQLPAGKPTQDEYFGLVDIYTGFLDIPVTIKEAAGEFILSVKYQGCTEGLCYAPQTRTRTFSLQKTSTAIPPPSSENTTVSKSEYLSVDEAFKLTPVIKGDQLQLHWAIADAYYLYKHRFKIAISGSEHEPIAIPKGKPTHDEYFGDVEIFDQDFFIPITLINPSENIQVEVSYQGCTEGLCYAPKTKQLNLTTKQQSNQANLSTSASAEQTPDKTSASNKQQPETGKKSAVQSEAAYLSQKLNEGNVITLIGIFFILGLGLSLTPCVFPMYPVLSSIILGQGESMKTRKSLLLSLTYVQGIALTYAGIGIAIASLGSNVSAFFQQPAFIIPVVILLLLMSLSMFGFYELQLPGFLRERLNSASNKQKGGTYFGVFVMGVISTLILSPCTSGPLISAFIYIGLTGDKFIGGISLYALGLGMGTPLIAVIGGLLPRAGAWMNAVKSVFGVAIIAVALQLADPLLPGPIYLILWAALFITSALYMKIFVWPSETNWQTFWKGIGFILFIYGAILLVGAAMGNGKMTRPLEGLNAPVAHSNSGGVAAIDGHAMFTQVASIDAIESAIKKANAQGKTVMLDFFAEWCTACFELADYTFPDPKVQQALKNTVLLQVDLTQQNTINKAIERHYQVLGLPMILFFNTQGQELTDFRVAGFVPAEAFAEHVNLAFTAN